MNKDYFKKFVKIDEKVESNYSVWLYTRVSSKGQFDSNNSIENQRDAAFDLANKNGYTIAKTFGETYESAKGDFTRKEFKKLIETVLKSKKKPFAIMIYKMSRFSRTGGGAIGLVNELVRNHGVHLIEVSTNRNTTTPRGEQDIIDSLVHARKENIERLEITIPGLTNFVKSGNWLGKAPRGYDHYGPRVKNLKFISGVQELKINHEGKLLKKAWKWKLQEKPDHLIIKDLELLGLKIPKQSLSAMWRNPFYCGIQTNKFLKGEIVVGNWNSIVSVEDFKTVNDRLDNKNIKEYEQTIFSKDRPLQTFLYCTLCGSKLTGYKAKHKFDYYKCLNPKCKCKDMNACTSAKSKHDGVHNLFSNYLNNYSLKDEYMVVFKEQLKLAIESTEFEKFENQKILQKKLIEIETKLNSIEQKYLFDGLDKSIYDKHNSELIREKSKLNEKIDDTNSKISNLDKKIDSCIELSKNISKHWGLGNFETKKGIQKLLFPSGLYIDSVNRQYRTKKINSIFVLINSLSSDNDVKKEDESGENSDSSYIVAGTGLEPVTFGL